MGALQYADVPGYSAILFRRTYEDLNLPGALIPRAKEWLYPVLGERAWNEQRSRWTFPSGATLHFGYLRHGDDHFRYQGMEAQYIGVDEAGQIAEHQLRYLFSRLRKPDDGVLSQVPLRMRLASNPGGRSHEYLKRRYIDRMVDPADAEDTDEKAQARVFIAAKLADNPSLDQAAYRASLAQLEPEVRAQLLDGDWDARQPGDWYFDDRHLGAVAQLGREYEKLLADGDLDFVAGGLAYLGIDTGESWHSVLGLPTELGGMFIAREYVATGAEPTDSTQRSLALNAFGLPFGRARYDAAGIQSMRTFRRESERLLGAQAPRPSKIAFGSYKGETATYLRRLVRRAGEGQVVQVLAVSPHCPVLLRQLKKLERDPENPTGAWRKDADQHGPDAAVALIAPLARKFREAAASEREVADVLGVSPRTVHRLTTD